ncbi:hypothetical protein EJ05DRAFT_503785 [Pseudovirgaria hyperparasitica]|uniref:Uncharacterized protein n=1 Tax=Pseudovirgaria hyperparasitica TaxID=470096 RepID=A0A6A6VX91_9PEZI|nr:uncharacterized protein EJ05DRAFT_503785 [Pseudovirgaria hyperparasitica]KAF2754843.1 hypothetical protein EJ05DRAFT_503785 [Pseudovirgaria hyperparasitica]
MKSLLFSLVLSGALPLATAIPQRLSSRGVIPETMFSNTLGPVGNPNVIGAQFGVRDDTCRGHLTDNSKDYTSKCWGMDKFTVNEFVRNRKSEINDCARPCLFYTSSLSGAAEAQGGYVLRSALQTAATEERKYLTIWELHDDKYYPFDKDWSITPESRCAFEDFDKKDEVDKVDGCQRSYFRAMSKAMALQCSGEVFILTNGPDPDKLRVPTNGIWWDTEFPTLITGARPDDKKVTKITYLQIDNVPKENRKDASNPPEIINQGEYWPQGPGADHLRDWNKQLGATANPGARPGMHPRTNEMSGVELSNSNDTMVAAKPVQSRSEEDQPEILTPDDGDEYPYAWSIEDMVDMYGGIQW